MRSKTSQQGHSELPQKRLLGREKARGHLTSRTPGHERLPCVGTVWRPLGSSHGLRVAVGVEEWAVETAGAAAPGGPARS